MSEKYYEKLRLSNPTLPNDVTPSFWAFLELLKYLDQKLSGQPFLNHKNDENVLIFDHQITTKTNSKSFSYLKTNQVTFELFETSFYPTFSNSFTKKYSASICWTEIQSYIKGSIEVLSSSDGYLELNNYLQLADRRVSILNADDRREIYKVWLQYEHLKEERQKWDIADLTFNLLKRFQTNSFDNEAVSHVYLDEVQDLTQTQIGLFRYICRNKDGFIFGGDTAQCVSSGVGFRFEDIRRLFYEYFLNKESKDLPEIFHLTQNYRTHSGILKLSSDIIELILKIFPDSIDRVNTDQGAIIYGVAPSIFIEKSTVRLLEQLFDIDHTDGGRIEMGADQVIIVRNEAAREKLTKIIPLALILTVFESKGLEFDDVLIYNFFNDSTFTRWRLVLDNEGEINYHGFDEKRDHGLCHELKALYVAATRARTRLWFFDESDVQNSMIDYWKGKNSISFITPETRDLHFARASSKESWNERGLEFFERKQYERAMVCYERSFNKDQVLNCKGQMEIIQAETFLATGKTVKAYASYAIAGELFESIADLKAAAKCFFEAHNYERAARLFNDTEQFREALSVSLFANLSQLALKVMKNSKQKIDTRTLEKNARLFALQVRGDNSLMLSFLEFLPFASVKSFLKRYNEFDLLYEYSIRIGDWNSCAYSAEKKRLFFKSFEFYQKGLNAQGAVEIALKYFLRPVVLEQIDNAYVDSFIDTSAKCHFKVESETVFKFLETFITPNTPKEFEIKCLYVAFSGSDLNLMKNLSNTPELPRHLKMILCQSVVLEMQRDQSRFDPAFLFELVETSLILSKLMAQVSGDIRASQSRGFMEMYTPIASVDDTVQIAYASKSFTDLRKKDPISFTQNVLKLLANWKEKMISAVNRTVREGMAQMTLCPSKRLNLENICRKKDCKFEHDKTVSIATYPKLLEMRLLLLELLLSMDSMILKVDIREHVRSLIIELYAESCYTVDIFYFARAIIKKRLNLAIDWYSTYVLTEPNYEFSLRSVLLSFVSGTKREIVGKEDESIKYLVSAFGWNEAVDHTDAVFGYLQEGTNYIRWCYDKKSLKFMPKKNLKFRPRYYISKQIFARYYGSVFVSSVVWECFQSRLFCFNFNFIGSSGLPREKYFV
jgi:tetratricopeptide (TPR) repeat protein